MAANEPVGMKGMRSLLPRSLQRAFRPGWRERARAVGPAAVGILLRDWQRSLADRVVECHVNGLTLNVGIISEMERFRARTYATKEPETLRWIDAHIRTGDVLFDVGANIGLYSLYAAKRCPSSRVYAFEPEANNYARLCRNIRVNDCENVVPCNLAVSGDTGFGLFEARSVQAGAALHGIAGFRMSDSSDEPILRQGVATVGLDTLVERYGLPQPTLIKVDVDGVEEQIFEAAQKVISNLLLRTVLVEISLDPKNPSPIELSLLRHGFRLVEKSDWTGHFGDIQTQNYIFTR